MSGMRRASFRAGFSFPELLVVVALAAVIIAGVQRALVGQIRFHEVQRAASARNESVRFGLVVLTGSLREASVAAGDVEILSPRSLRVRIPRGSALVCGADANGSRIGIVAAQGDWAAGDSVRLRGTGGQAADRIAQIDPGQNRVACSEAATGSILRLDQRHPGVIPETAVRTFQSHVLESVVQGGDQWLYRDDGTRRDLLVGPLDATSGFSAWYETDAGVVVPDLASADRVVVRLVARAPDVRGRVPLVRDTVLLVFGGTR